MFGEVLKTAKKSWKKWALKNSVFLWENLLWKKIQLLKWSHLRMLLLQSFRESFPCPSWTLPSWVMVRWGVYGMIRQRLISANRGWKQTVWFIETCWKSNSTSGRYRLQRLPDFCFQLDSAPTHKTKVTQTWLLENVPYFISMEKWCSASTDLNPLDYRLWTDSEAIICNCWLPSLTSLKAALVKVVQEFRIELMNAKTLGRCIHNESGHFE